MVIESLSGLMAATKFPSGDTATVEEADGAFIITGMKVFGAGVSRAGGVGRELSIQDTVNQSIVMVSVLHSFKLGNTVILFMESPGFLYLLYVRRNFRKFSSMR